jgi:hypothetical protein
VRFVWLALFLAAPAARAESPPSIAGFYVRDQVAARLNPLGAFDELRGGWRQPMFSPRARALRHNFVGAALNASVSPAFARAGVFVEYAPLAFVDFYGIYEAGAYFGPAGLHSFPTAGGAHYSDDDLTRDPVYSGAMHQLIAGTLLHLELGPVFVRSNSRFVFEQVDIRPGDRVFYDPNWDVLFPNKGWIYVNDVDVQVQPFRHFRVGVRYDVTHAFFSSPDLATSDTTQRIGPIASYVFFEHPRAAFNTPMLALVVNWWIEHPYRTGGPAPGSISQAIPYVGVAFSFRSNPR